MSIDTYTLLRQYRSLKQEQQAVAEMIKHLRVPNGPGIVHANSTNGIPRGTNDKTAAVMQVWNGLEERMMRIDTCIQRVACQCEDAIQGLDDPLDRAIARRYFLIGQTQEEVADVISKDASTVRRRLHRIKNKLN